MNQAINNFLSALPFLGSMTLYLANVKDFLAIILMIVSIVYYIVKIKNSK